MTVINCHFRQKCIGVRDFCKGVIFVCKGGDALKCTYCYVECNAMVLLSPHECVQILGGKINMAATLCTGLGYKGKHLHLSDNVYDPRLCCSPAVFRIEMMAVK